MLRHKVVSGVEVEWTLVSVKHPCTVCGGHHGCRRGFADEFGCCTRVLSEWPLTAGGWVHRLDLQVDVEAAIEVSAPRARDARDAIGDLQRTGAPR